MQQRTSLLLAMAGALWFVLLHAPLAAFSSPDDIGLAELTRLSGPLSGLSFGMAKEEARAVAPAWVGKGKPVGDMRVELMFDETGLFAVHATLPAERGASMVEAALGAPDATLGGKREERLWFHEAERVRVHLYRGKRRAWHLELLPYQPLEQAVRSVLMPAGRPTLLGAAPEELANTYRIRPRRGIPRQLLVPAHPYGLGSIAMAVKMAGGRIAQYELVLDWLAAPDHPQAVLDALAVALQDEGLKTLAPRACVEPMLPGVRAAVLRICREKARLQVRVRRATGKEEMARMAQELLESSAEGGTGIGASTLDTGRGQDNSLAEAFLDAAPGKATAGPAQASGRELTAADIDKGIRQREALIRACYTKERQAKPELAGKLVVTFKIEPDGTVTSPSINAAASTLRDTNVETCVVRQLSQLKFPASDKGAKVNYPLLFSKKQ